MFQNAESIIQKIMKPRGGKIININNIKQEVIAQLEEFFVQERGRKPLLIADIIQM